LAPSTSASEFPAVKVSVIAEQSADIDAAKLRVRTSARSNRDALSSGLGAAAVTGVAARFMSQEELASATGIGTVVSGYASIGSEIDWELDSRCREQWRLCLGRRAFSSGPCRG